MSQLLITFYGDDFTGSTDALEFLTRAGIKTALFIEPPTAQQLAGHPGLQAVGVAGMTRAMTPAAMTVALPPALTALRQLGAPHVHYKVCSTFDSSPAIGSIGCAIDLAAGLFPAPFIPLLVGAPALGRHCVFGNLFARFGTGGDGEIHRLDRHPAMSKHPVTPADESDLRRHLAKQTAKRIGLFDILQLELPEPQTRTALEKILAGGAEIVLFDALHPGQLPRIGALIDAYASRERPLFSVGSSGIEMALAAHWVAQGRLPEFTGIPHAPAEAHPAPAPPVLIASGSCSPVTEQQIAWAVAHGFAEVPVDTAALAVESTAPEEINRATDLARAHVQASRNVILHTSTGAADPRITRTAARLQERGLTPAAMKSFTAQTFGAALGKIIRQAVADSPVRRVIFAGGDTSSYAARALGIESLVMIAPIVPGAPLCRAHAPGSPVDGLEVNFKGGQVGGPDYFGLAVQVKA